MIYNLAACVRVRSHFDVVIQKQQQSFINFRTVLRNGASLRKLRTVARYYCLESIMKSHVPVPQQDEHEMDAPLTTIGISNPTDVETGTESDISANTNKKSPGQGLRNGTGGVARRRRLWYILGGVSVLLLAAAIAVAVVVFGSRGGGLTPQQQQLSEIAKSISSEDDLHDSATPQAMAYGWLINEDTFYEGLDTIPRDLAAQRYVLAVFYYATNGPDKWKLTTNWLMGSECLAEWSGISCNDQGSVRTLQFGTS